MHFLGLGMICLGIGVIIAFLRHPITPEEPHGTFDAVLLGRFLIHQMATSLLQHPMSFTIHPNSSKERRGIASGRHDREPILR